MIFTVAIVDDDARLIKLLSERLTRTKGFRCMATFTDPLEAAEKLPELKPDIILMDINMPGINGIECIKRIKPLLPETDIIMLTVYEDTTHICNALAAGAVGYLRKFEAIKKLIPALEETVKGGAPMDSFIARRFVQSYQTNKNKELEELTDRELEILQQIAAGRMFKQIADDFGISYHTVNAHARRIYEKLNVSSRAEAVAKMRGIS